MEAIIRDVRFTLRLLWKTKGFTIASLLTLALCIGANTAIFSMLYAVVLRPLPFPNSDRLVEIFNSYPNAGFEKMSSNIPLYLDYRNETSVFENLTLYQSSEFNIGEEHSPARVKARRVTPEYFNVLGVSPHLGRFFDKSNAIPGQDEVIVLSYAFWKDYFGGDSTVMGQSSQVSGRTMTIIGVAPAKIHSYDHKTQFWHVWAWDPDKINRQSRHANYAKLLGRLKPDTTIAQAKAQVDTLDKRFYQNAPQFHDFLDRSGHRTIVANHRIERIRSVRSTLLFLQGSVLCVLFIGCINIANLLLARANARRSEFAMRSALGANRWSLARQLLTENIVLSIGGGATGLFVGWGAIHLINAFAVDLLPSVDAVSLEAHTLMFALVLALLTGFIFGSFPIVRVIRTNISQIIQQSSPNASIGPTARLGSTALVSIQAAMAMILLSSTVLLLRSFAKILAVEPGFNPESVLTARMDLPKVRYPESDDIYSFQRRILETLQDIPGVEAVGLSTHVPMTTGYPVLTFQIMGYTMAEGEEQMGAFRTWVSPGYFAALQIPHMNGRVFDYTDSNERRITMVIDQQLADRYFPSENAVGHNLSFSGSPDNDEDWPTIIGVVHNVRHLGLTDESDRPFVYSCIFQHKRRTFSVFLRSKRAESDLLPIVRNRVGQLDRQLPLFLTGKMESFVSDALSDRTILLALVIAMALIALSLMSVGIYGVLSYDVSQQKRDMGIRIAIGASMGQIRLLILKRGLWQVGIGVLIGIFGIWVLRQLLQSFVFGIESMDWLSILITVIVLAIVSVLACYIPARRATLLDPSSVLREM